MTTKNELYCRLLYAFFNIMSFLYIVSLRRATLFFVKIPAPLHIPHPRDETRQEPDHCAARVQCSVWGFVLHFFLKPKQHLSLRWSENYWVRSAMT